jgi:hypothetical protein
MRFTHGDVRDHIVSSEIDHVDFRLPQQNPPRSDIRSDLYPIFGTGKPLELLDQKSGS